MLQNARNFSKDETGAVTVDWVVLTGLVVGLLFGAMVVFQDGTVAHADLAGSTMTDQGIPDY